jgi:uncharacterized protein (DUF983 family)
VGTRRTVKKKQHPIAPWRMVVRGILASCPRCGSRGLWHSWFKMKERCPTCGYKIARDEGFWLGGYTMNVVIGEGLLGLHLLVFAGWILNNPDKPIRTWVYVAIVLAVVPPVLFFKFSRTIWMAMDLLIHPLEPWEEADAELHKASAAVS